MSDSENQGPKWKTACVPADFGVAEQWKMQGHYVARYEADDRVSALEATITTLKAQLEAAEIMLRAIAEADTWGEGDGNLISALKVDIPADGYPRQHIQQAAQRWLDALSAPVSDTGSEEGA